MDTELFGTPCDEFRKVNKRGPIAVQTAAIVLNAAAVVPDLVAGNRHFAKTLFRRRVLDPVSESQENSLSQWSSASNLWSEMYGVPNTVQGALYIIKLL